ncbi:unnamed protein product [Discosporangium mesarthrocarpum]
MAAESAAFHRFDDEIEYKADLERQLQIWESTPIGTLPPTAEVDGLPQRDRQREAEDYLPQQFPPPVNVLPQIFSSPGVSGQDLFGTFRLVTRRQAPWSWKNVVDAIASSSQARHRVAKAHATGVSLQGDHQESSGNKSSGQGHPRHQSREGRQHTGAGGEWPDTSLANGNASATQQRRRS